MMHQLRSQQKHISHQQNPLDVIFLPNDHHPSSPNSERLSFDPQEMSSHCSSGSPPPMPISPTPYTHPQIPSFQSLPPELIAPPPSNSPSPNGSSRLFKGFKSWVKGRKDSRNGSNGGGYASDASSTTLTASVPRQEPDGAPASSPRRKSGGDFRAEIIAASRQRNGDISPDEDQYSSSNSRRSMSPETRKLTQELPELVQERREYKEYRSSRHSHSQSPSAKISYGMNTFRFNFLKKKLFYVYLDNKI